MKTVTDGFLVFSRILHNVLRLTYFSCR